MTTATEHETIHLTADGVPEIVAAGDDATGPKIAIAPAYAGGPIKVSAYPKPVVIDLGGLQIGDTVPLARDHSTKTADLLGTLVPSTDGRTLNAAGHLNTSPAAGEIVRLWKSKQKLSASVGVQPEKWRMIEPGDSVCVNGRTIQSEQGFVLIEAGRLREISIVGVGADGDTEVSIEAALSGGTGASKMTTEVQDDVRAERARVTEIHEIADRYRDQLGDDVVAGIEASAVEEGLSVDAFCRNVLDQLRESRPKPPAVRTPRLRQERDAIEVLACASMMQHGFGSVAEASYDESTVQAAADLGITNTVDLARYAVQLASGRAPRDRAEMIEAAFSTSQLSEALRGGMQNVLLDAYRGVPSDWRKIAARKSVSNFHEHKGVRPFLKDGEYDEVGADGELKHASLDESTLSYQAFTFGKMFGVTRQQIINDSIGAVYELQQEIGRDAGRTLNSRFWKLIREAQAAGFFSAGNGNLLTGATSMLSLESLAKAIKLMREAKDEDGEAIDIIIGALAVPPALEGYARSILTSLELNQTGDDEPTSNPWKGVADLVVDPRIGAVNGGNDKSWYLFAAPITAPAALAAFLDGKETPTVERIDAPANVLGFQYRAYIDFGFSLGDVRGGIKAAGQ